MALEAGTGIAPKGQAFVLGASSPIPSKVQNITYFFIIINQALPLVCHAMAVGWLWKPSFAELFPANLQVITCG